MSTHSNHPDATERNELDLIARVRAGENECFHELIRPYERAMYSLAYSVLRNAADAEDVAQEAAFKAFQQLGQLQEDDKFKSWLLRIANNEARMRRRKDRPHLYESIDSSDQEEENGDFRPHSFADWRDLPGDALDREELRKAIRAGVAKLPEKYRTVFVLADGQSLAYSEIAETLNLTIANVKTRLHRARQLRMLRISPEELKKKLDDQSDITVLDLRHPLDLIPNPVKIPGALRIPMAKLAEGLKDLQKDREIVLYCTCPSEATSAMTVLRVHQLGFHNVRPLAGGLYGWRDLGYPLHEAFYADDRGR